MEGSNDRTDMAKDWLGLYHSTILPYCHHLSVNQRFIIPYKEDNVKQEMSYGIIVFSVKSVVQHVPLPSMA